MIQARNIADGAVTASKVNFTTSGFPEMYFTYTQEENVASGFVYVDIPVDLIAYREIRVEGYAEPTGGKDEGALLPITASAGAISVFQAGTEVWDTSKSFINRSRSALVSYGQIADGASTFSAEIRSSMVDNFPAFEARGVGGLGTDSRRAQNLSGVIQTIPSNVAYIRVQLLRPKKGAWVKAWRLY